ncbi:MAG TPA: methylmalonyl Co-A mutase-associated GTPase MeaB [Chloroflexota bacterium]|nr:methylmalonyl Co-A mutase-associated GTPase MeaB [Chloroflexota bacterium]
MTSPSPANLAERLLGGDRRALARALTMIERGGADGAAIVEAIFARTGRAHLIGWTGAPGVGKSTVVTAVARRLRSADETIGIVAVDPSSPFTGGALLGDRIRMQSLAGDRGVFIRSMAARDARGGLARATVDAARVLDAAGFDRVMVETVGAGQDDVEIAYAVDTVVLIDVPHLGDDIQANKAGLTEIADIFVVNKADQGDADRTAATIRQSLSLAPTPGDWKHPIVKVSATTGDGVEDLIRALDRHRDYLSSHEQAVTRRRDRLKREIINISQEELLSRLLARLGDGVLTDFVEQTARREISPRDAALRLIDKGK